MEGKCRTAQLVITENCNLNCIYCYEKHKKSVEMDFLIAQKILDYEFSLLDEEEKLYIDIFGGEPFLNFDLIKKIVEYVSVNYKKKCFAIFATTNGTLIHDEIQEWLKKNKDKIILGLSLDGNKKAHDLNRCNSFDLIDLDFFLNTYPSQDVKMTISQDSLPFLFESIVFLHEKGFKVHSNLGYMINWENAENEGMLRQQLELLMEFYLNRRKSGANGIKECSLFDFDVSALGGAKTNSATYKKYCGCGTAMHCYMPDGKMYPCQLFAPITCGEDAILMEHFSLKEDLSKQDLPLKCQECYFLKICPQCLGSNYVSNHNLFVSDDNKCKLNQIIFEYNALYKARLWNEGLLSLTKKDEQYLLRAIKNILKI